MTVNVIEIVSAQRQPVNGLPLSPTAGPGIERSFDRDLTDAERPVGKSDAPWHPKEIKRDDGAAPQSYREVGTQSEDDTDSPLSRDELADDDPSPAPPESVATEAAETAPNPNDNQVHDPDPGTVGAELLQLGQFRFAAATASAASAESGSANGAQPQFSAWNSLVLDSVTTLVVATPDAEPTVATQAPTTPLIETQTPVEEANVARVVRGIRSAINQRGGSVTLRLHPPELGFVKIQIQMNEAVVRAEIASEHPAVRVLLQQQMGQLRAALEGQGLQVERLVAQTLTPSQTTDVTQQQTQDAASDGRSRGAFDQPTDGESGEEDGNDPDRDQITRFQQMLNTIA
jgi:hypothetical protein